MEDRKSCSICGQDSIIVIVNSDDEQLYFSCNEHFEDVMTCKLHKTLDQEIKEKIEKQADLLLELKQSSRKLSRKSA